MIAITDVNTFIHRRPERDTPRTEQRHNVHSAACTATWSLAAQTQPSDVSSPPDRFLSTTPENQSWKYMNIEYT